MRTRTLPAAHTFRLIALTISILSTMPCAANESAAGVSPDQVLKRLTDGNARFAAGRCEHPNAGASRRVETAAKGQKPMATIVSCSDSRVPVEILFDAGIGDLFVVRVAGNVCDTDEIATVEYGVEHLGTPLLVIVGHSKCGAVTAVATHATVGGSIPKLVDNIVPAVAAAQLAHPDLHGEALVPDAIRANVFQSIQDLLKNSEIARQLVATGRLRIEGALYDLEKGTVQWLGRHPQEAKWLVVGSMEHRAEQASAEHKREPVSEGHGTESAIAGHETESADREHKTESINPGHKADPADPVKKKHGVPTSRPRAVAAAKEATAQKRAGEPTASQPAHETVATHNKDQANSLASREATPAATQPEGAPSHGLATAGEQVLAWTPSTRPSAEDTQTVPPAARPVALLRGGPGVLERNKADEFYRQGAAHLIQGEDAAAADLFREALKLDPSLTAAMTDLAGVYYLQRDYGKALDLYNTVLAADQNDEFALRGSALVYASQKRYAESRDILQKLLTRNDRDAQAWLDLGDVLFLMGDGAGAADRWRQAAEANPSAASVIRKANQRLATNR